MNTRVGLLYWAAAYASGGFLWGPIATFGQEIQKTAEQSAIRADVSLVSAPVVVRDAKGNLVMGLSEKDLRVFDNGVEQAVEDFELSRAPISMVVVVENSSRIEALLPDLRRIGILFTQKVLGESGEVAVIGYDDTVVKLLDFSGDGGAIENAFAGLRSGTSEAHLYDALSEAVEMLRKTSPSRRGVIVSLAEAFDSWSEKTLSQVLRQAEIADVTLYSVGLSTTTAGLHSKQQQAAPLRGTPPGTFALPATPGSVNTPTIEQLHNGNIDLGGLVEPVWSFTIRKPPIEAAAAATGGLYQSTFGKATIEMAINEIAGELSAQYTLTYLRSGSNTVGYHKIRVEIAGPRGLKAHYRTGYYLIQP